MGKQLIIVGADFSAVAIDSRQQVPMTIPSVLTIADIGGTTSLSYSSSVSVASWTITSDNTAIATVAASGNPRTITGVAAGNTRITITAVPTDTTTYRPTTKSIPIAVSSVVPGTWTVSATILHGTAASTTVLNNGTATLTVVPDTNYTYPLTATVGSGTAGTPVVSGATITVPNVTSDVVISAECVAVEPDIPVVHETITLTSSNISDSDDAHTVATSQTVGSAITLGTAGTLGIYVWDIPAYSEVVLNSGSGGSYGMALTNNDDEVLEYWTNSVTPKTCAVYPYATKLWVSRTKFVSATYTTQTMQDLEGKVIPISTYVERTGYYVSTTQTIGADVAFNPMNNYNTLSCLEIPAHTFVTITCKDTSAGGYGMVLATLNNKVVEYFTHSSTASTNNEHVCAVQEIKTKIFVSSTKFQSATYTYHFSS